MVVLEQKERIPNDFLSASKKSFIGNSSTHVHEFFELEYVIKCGNRKGGVKVVIKSIRETSLPLCKCRIINLIIAGHLKCGDTCHKLIVRGLSIIKVLPGEHKISPIVRLHAEETVNERIVPLLLKKRNGKELTL